jgi:hypothetical protein
LTSKGWDVPEILKFSLYLLDRKAVEGFFFNCLFFFRGGVVMPWADRQGIYDIWLSDNHLPLYKSLQRPLSIPKEVGTAMAFLLFGDYIAWIMKRYSGNIFTHFCLNHFWVIFSMGRKVRKIYRVNTYHLDLS